MILLIDRNGNWERSQNSIDVEKNIGLQLSSIKREEIRDGMMKMKNRYHLLFTLMMILYELLILYEGVYPSRIN